MGDARATAPSASTSMATSSIMCRKTTSLHTGTRAWPEQARPLSVYAAAFQDTPVSCQLIDVWTIPPRMKITEKQSVGQRIRKMVGVSLLGWLVAAAVFLPRRNHRRGRGDREGA